jgi:hypothetical protein
MKVLKWLALSATALLSACASRGEIDPATAAPSDSESVVVLGVRPGSIRVGFFPGSVEDNQFQAGLFRNAAFIGASSGGFFVAKAKAGDTLGLTRLVVEGNGSLLYPIYEPCGGQKVMTFQVPKGKVVYLGSIDLSASRGQIGYAYAAELELARQYMDEKYPVLKGRVEMLEPHWFPAGKGCGPTTLAIPVLVGR